MKNIKFIYLKITLLLGFIFMMNVACERGISDEVEFASFSANPEVFIDGFSGGLEYLPFGDSYFEAFSVDTETTFNSSSASMRFDVPTVGDPNGAYAGAIFPDKGGRDLSGFDALTFWAKATQGATLDLVGFGNDFGENKFMVTLPNVQVTTNWRKYTIPIPDPDKLTLEKGMFWYAEGPENGYGYTFWIDELKYEKLGTIAQPQPAIFNGVDIVEQSFTGIDITIEGTQTFNLGSGRNQTVIAAPSYFTFTSSDVDVARVSEIGIISVIGAGTATITATLGGVKAKGSLTIESLGSFPLPPIPTRDPSNVISIFSDTYTNVPVDFFNGYWQPYQTTQSADFVADGNHILNYTDFNFVGNQFANPTIDASQKSNIHINMYIPGEVPANMDFLITLVDFGADKAEGGGDDTRQQVFFNKAIWTANTWITLEFPITMTNKNAIGQIIYENINFSSLTNFYLDNIYFYK